MPRNNPGRYYIWNCVVLSKALWGKLWAKKNVCATVGGALVSDLAEPNTILEKDDRGPDAEIVVCSSSEFRL